MHLDPINLLLPPLQFLPYLISTTLSQLHSDSFIGISVSHQRDDTFLSHLSLLLPSSTVSTICMYMAIGRSDVSRLASQGPHP